MIQIGEKIGKEVLERLTKFIETVSPHINVKKESIHPHGLISNRLWHEERRRSIWQAIDRYTDCKKDVPQEWRNELEYLNAVLQAPNPDSHFS